MRALVVIDMQEKYMDRYDDGLVENINKKIKLAHEEEDVSIVYVKNVGVTGNNTGYELTDDLLLVSDLVFEKRRPSAFSSKEFAHKIKSLKTTELELIGIDGSSCVAKTAMDALKLGYKTEIVRACVGARNDKVYEKTLKKLEDAGVRIL
ncbi:MULTISPECIES: cysteine hydrolase family protein [unclassified Butyrivibrio]|jgi:nicotinamidase-related amidase|uniref:cysteine hydrolase family protein n=1 Tax=unclassified Butyrivibrio TaxID=2639466 RepID=UPI00042889C1|nr:MULTISPECIES: isochorismatase family cysteine hydrolase [unclassified Butyrivibrio]MCR5342093.1 cysteine hydrolase [Butyrivibrio sp.]